MRPFGISRDSPWSHASWAMTLGIDIPLLSDWNGEAARGFGVASTLSGMNDVATRSSFLIDGDTITAAWLLGRELPDVDAIIEEASSRSATGGEV